MLKYKETIINIIKGDITDQKVDAIVNAANNTLLGGGGVDGAIHEKGGRIILEQCKKHGGCPTGEVRLTTAGDLPCKYVIHAVGPIYNKHYGNESKLLYNAYYNSLKISQEYNFKTISFPSISTGAYGYPIEEAVIIVFDALRDFLATNTGFKEINLCLFSDEDYMIYLEYFSDKLI